MLNLVSFVIIIIYHQFVLQLCNETYVNVKNNFIQNYLTTYKWI